MLKISGVGDMKLEKYGIDFLAEIRNYCKNKHEKTRINLKTTKRAPKSRTKRDENGENSSDISLRMFKSGFSIDEIAEARDLAKSTIEMHLIRFIPSGEIMIEELVSDDKIEAIREAVIRFSDSGSLSTVREFLGEDYSYGEIRAVLATL